MDVEVIELRPAEGTLVNDLPIPSDEEHGAGNRVLDRGGHDRIGGRDSLLERITPCTCSPKIRTLLGTECDWQG